MKYLLDTHILIWWLVDSPKLTNYIRSIIANPNNIIFVSSASTWEIAIKTKLGKLDHIEELEKVILDCRFIPLSITIEHSVAVCEIPEIHKDPFDRILVAQAIIEKLKIITNDKLILQYNVDAIKV